MALLRVNKGPGTGTEIEVSRSHFVIGRGKDADFMISDPSMSRKHAEVIIENLQFTINDLGSANGIRLNGMRVSSKTLQDGDEIILGSSELIFISPNVSDAKTEVDNSAIQFKADQNNYDDDEASIILDAKQFEELNKQLMTSPGSAADSSDSSKKFRLLQAMLRVSNAVGNEVELQKLLDKMMDIIFDETNASRGFFLLYDGDGELTPMAIKKVDGSDDTITISKTIINMVVDQKKAILSSDMMNDDRFDAGMSIIANEIRSCMCAPLLYHDKIIGAVHIDSNLTTNIFNYDDLELLTAIGNQAAICIENSRLLKQVTEEENKRSKLSQFFPPAQVDLLMKGELDMTLGGKTETVTMIFCDIRSFTKISEGMKANDVMSFLNEFFTAMTEIIFEFEGMVDNFMGDCIMAVFGGPIHHHDDPERAIKAAIKMQHAQEKLNEQWELEGRQTFGIGIGIHSGNVSRGNIGSPQMKKYTVIGSNVNVSARLCSQAKSKEILVSNATAKLVGDAVKLEEQPPVMVKNVSEPLVPHLVIY
jgi:adenylate cyclase